MIRQMRIYSLPKFVLGFPWGIQAKHFQVNLNRKMGGFINIYQYPFLSYICEVATIYVRRMICGPADIAL